MGTQLTEVLSIQLFNYGSFYMHNVSNSVHQVWKI